MKKQLILTILVIAALLSGCVENKLVTIDTYHCEGENGMLFLSSDGQYEMLIDEKYGGGGIYGNYSIRDERLLLKRSFLGDLLVFTINDTYLIDRDGDRWLLV